MLLRKSGGHVQVAQELMKWLGQSRKDTQLWTCLEVKGKSDAAKINCKRTWNVRSMNLGKLDVVKQEMARINMDILGISELKWTGMVNSIQTIIISTIVGKNSVKEME